MVNSAPTFLALISAYNGAVLHGREEILPAYGVVSLCDLLGEMEVVLADNDVLDGASAPPSDFLLDFVRIEEVLAVPEGDRRGRDRAPRVET